MASDDIREDKEFIISLLKNKGNKYIIGASHKLLNDKEFILSLLRDSYNIFSYLSMRLRDDKEVVEKVLKHKDFSLSRINKRLKDDKAIEIDKNNPRYISECLRNNVDIILKTI